MNITMLRDLVLTDGESQYYTKDLELYLSLNLWLNLHLVDNDNPDKYPSIDKVGELILELVNYREGDAIDISPVVTLLHPELDWVKDPGAFAFGFNRYYRIELDCFGNRRSIVEFFRRAKNQMEEDPKMLETSIKRFLQGYIESVKLDARKLLNIK